MRGLLLVLSLCVASPVFAADADTTAAEPQPPAAEKRARLSAPT